MLYIGSPWFSLRRARFTQAQALAVFSVLLRGYFCTTRGAA